MLGTDIEWTWYSIPEGLVTYPTFRPCKDSKLMLDKDVRNLFVVGVSLVTFKINTFLRIGLKKLRVNILTNGIWCDR